MALISIINFCGSSGLYADAPLAVSKAAVINRLISEQFLLPLWPMLLAETDELCTVIKHNKASGQHAKKQ